MAEALPDRLATLEADFRAIKADVVAIRCGLQRIEKKVFFGNGEDSLLTRLSKLDSRLDGIEGPSLILLKIFAAVFVSVVSAGLTLKLFGGGLP